MGTGGPMFKGISLYPPLAFARVGSSPTPCDNFYWGPDDLTPDGTARTRIVPWETLDVDGDGRVTLREPNGVIFKDNEGLRPVCPFFEVHVVGEDGNEQPLTDELLDKAGLKPGDLKWQVKIANLKAFHLTGVAGDRVEASLEFSSGESRRQELKGCSPQGDRPLVPANMHIPLGAVQATQPGGDFPEFRLRFTPPSGKVYAPANFKQRLDALKRPDPVVRNVDEARCMILKGADPMKVLAGYLLSLNLLWEDFTLPASQTFLNPHAAWPAYRLINLFDLQSQLSELLPRLGDLRALVGPGDRSELIRALLGPFTDVGNLPPGLFAFVTELPNILASLGMVDDMADGTITVQLGDKTATSRIVIAPPSFAPDRRLPVSIADGLADRVGREAVRDDAWISGNEDMADKEVGDLLDRAYETAGLQNVDAIVDFFRVENTNRAYRRDNPLTPDQAADLLWDGEKMMTVQSLPLSAYALRRHRRNTARLFFEIFARENRGWFERSIRPPNDPQRFYDKRMPGLMRGFDRQPLHLTRRQYEALKAWAKHKAKP